MILPTVDTIHTPKTYTFRVYTLYSTILYYTHTYTYTIHTYILMHYTYTPIQGLYPEPRPHQQPEDEKRPVARHTEGLDQLLPTRLGERSELCLLNIVVFVHRM